MKTPFIFFLLLILQTPVSGQDKFPFRISMEPMIPSGFTGLQSYAWARSGSRILLVGGRTDGLHRPQPFAAFNRTNNNTSLIVIDLETEKTWKKDISTLPTPIAEQLQSTNMEFFQEGNTLILAGGYGYSESRRTHITHPSLLLIRVNEMVNAVVEGKDPLPFIFRMEDERMAVTGGRLSKLGDRYFLVGGQRFEGRYNPHGPDHGPGFSQQYTNQIRKFKINLNETEASISDYEAVTDSTHLHRRDYNLLIQVNETGEEILSIYSGVFQYDKDVPFTTLVDIRQNSHSVVTGFSQQFSHYHTATLPAYSRRNQRMYSVFFGGIAQFYRDSTGKIKSDKDIPFVKSISVVERSKDLILEYLLPDPMPGYFGAASEFIPADPKLFSPSGIFELDKLGRKPVLTGYIIGGIDSRAPNVFWSNLADPSRASPVVWKVYFTRY
ncbi:MAG: hypothetical protein ACO25B_02625 [Chitinophagaceae bacterium]